MAIDESPEEHADHGIKEMVSFPDRLFIGLQEVL
jgi:hypothetical protein